jgi:hypothetical protein
MVVPSLIPRPSKTSRRYAGARAEALLQRWRCQRRLPAVTDAEMITDENKSVEQLQAEAEQAQRELEAAQREAAAAAEREKKKK